MRISNAWKEKQTKLSVVLEEIGNEGDFIFLMDMLVGSVI